MTRRSITRAAIALVVVSTVAQVAALAALALEHPLSAGTTGRTVFSTFEMALVAALLVLGWQIVRWTAGPEGSPPARQPARLAFASLALCALGDLVNRNYPDRYFQYDHVIRHSYLVTSIWFFLPGYLVVVVANRLLTRARVSAPSAAVTSLVAASVGAGAYLTNHDPEVATRASAMVALYGVVLAVLAGSTTWLVRSYGWRASRVVVVGCLLAPVADALIANLWLYRDHFPTIEHVNWIIYFASLAMIQRLPFLAADQANDPQQAEPSVGWTR